MKELLFAVGGWELLVWNTELMDFVSEGGSFTAILFLVSFVIYTLIFAISIGYWIYRSNSIDIN